MRFALSLFVIAALAQSQADPDALLAQARVRLQALARRLERYVCIETVDRNYYLRVPRRDAAARPDATSACQEATGELQLESTDRLRLEVTFAESRELHSWPGATGFDTRDVDELIRDGPVSSGSFGGHLAGIFGNPGVTFHFKGQKSEQGRTMLEYSYRVPLAASRMKVKVAGAWLSAAYDGEFQLDRGSLDLERLTVRIHQPPPDAAFCSAATTLAYNLVHVGDGDVLLPRHSELEIVQPAGRETHNETTFAGCREYQAASELVFDQPAGPESAASPRAGRRRVTLPIGLPVTLALLDPIDSDTAATGDPLSAKVVKPVRSPGSKEDLLPAGSIVRGRIRRVERHFLPKPYYLIAVAFNRVEIGGVVAPFLARSEPPPDLVRELGANIELRATGFWYWDVGTFLFPTAKPHFVVPAGFESKWFTLAVGGGR